MLSSLKAVGVAAGIGLIIAGIVDIINNDEEAETAAKAMVAGFDPSATGDAVESLAELRNKVEELQVAYNNSDVADGWLSFLTDADENLEAYRQTLEETEGTQTGMTITTSAAPAAERP